jgi:hypothetical protein
LVENLAGVTICPGADSQVDHALLFRFQVDCHGVWTASPMPSPYPIQEPGQGNRQQIDRARRLIDDGLRAVAAAMEEYRRGEVL